MRVGREEGKGEERERREGHIKIESTNWEEDRKKV